MRRRPHLPWSSLAEGRRPMSEHIVALALAAAKRLLIEHANLKRGEFKSSS
jgi:hypothetical protein